MVLGLGLRTVWISLRALNYTDRAFRAANRNLRKLSEAEREHLRRLFDMKTEALANVQAGMMFAAMGTQMAGAMYQIASQSRTGAMYMWEFNYALQETQAALADTFFVEMRGSLDVIKGFLQYVRDTPALRSFIAGIMMAGSVLMTFGGIGFQIYGLVQGISASIKILNFWNSAAWVQWLKHTVAVKGATLAYWQLSLAVGAALAGLTLGYAIATGLNRPLEVLGASLVALAFALWGVHVAMSAVTVGAAALAGGIAAGAALATAQDYMAKLPHYPMGTLAVPRTGPAIVHKGEMIYNPRAGRPIGLEREIMGERGPTTNIYDIPIVIENVHTKAEYEDFADKVGEVFRKKGRRAR